MLKKYYISIDIRDKIFLLVFGYKSKKEKNIIEEKYIFSNLEELINKVLDIKDKVRKQIYISIIYNDENSQNKILDITNVKKKYKSIFIENELIKFKKDCILDYGELKKDIVLLSSTDSELLKEYINLFEKNKIIINKISNRIYSTIKFLIFNKTKENILLIDNNEAYSDIIYYKENAIEIERIKNNYDLIIKKGEILNLDENVKEIILADDKDIEKKNDEIDIFTPCFGNII